MGHQVSITIAPAANAAPSAVPDSATATSGQAKAINVLANDSDSDGTITTVTKVSNPSHGTAVVNGDKTITYTSTSGYVGSDSFTYKVTDDDGAVSNVATVSITVSAVPNVAPSVANDSATATSGQARVINVLANDSDSDGTITAVTKVSNPSHGTAVVNGDKTITYTSTGGYTGADSFTYRVTDDDGANSNVATVTVTVGAVPNSPPVAANDTGSAYANSWLTLDVLANDSDPNGDTLSITKINTTTISIGGSVSISSDETVRLVAGPVLEYLYTPPGGPPPQDPVIFDPPGFTYTVSDGQGGSDTASVSLSVTTLPPPNTPPTAGNDSVSAYSGQAKIIGVTSNDSDSDGAIASVTKVSNPSHGTAVVNGDKTITYTSTGGYTGSDSFTYKVTDDDGAVSNVATVSITVSAVPNVAPSVANDSATATSGQARVINVLANDSDSDGTITAVTKVSNPSHGTAVVNGDKTITYTSTGGYTGADSFTYRVTDDDGANSNVATVTVTVGAVPNSPPVAANDTGSAYANSWLTLDVLANDSDPNGDTLSITKINTTTISIGGSVSISSDETVRLVAGPVLEYLYTPPGGPPPQDPVIFDPPGFTYTVSDGQGGSDTASVSLSVTTLPPPNTPPTAGNDSVSAYSGQAKIIGVTSNDSDSDGAIASVTKVSNPSHGTAVVNGDKTITYTSTGGYTGSDSFTYKVTDDDGAVSNVATVSITVSAVPNVAPSVANDSATATSGQARVINVLANDSDSDGTITAVTKVSNPSHGTAVVNGDKTITYTSTGGYTGADSFTYRVTDDDGANSNVATVTVTVGAGATNAPWAWGSVPAVPSLNIGTPMSAFSFSSYGSDAEGDTTTFLKASGTLPPGLSLSSAGVLSGSPSAAGSYAFSVIGRSAAAGGGTQDSAATSVSITVSGGVTASVVYQYDALGRLELATYDDDNWLGYTYDPNGNRTSLQSGDASTTLQDPGTLVPTSGMPPATLVLFDDSFVNGASSVMGSADTVAITPAGDPPGHMSASLKIVSGVWSSPGIMKEETIGSGNRILRMYVLRTAGSSGTFNVRHTTNWESITLDAASNANWRIDGLTGRSTGADLSDNDWHLLEIDLQALGVTSFKALTVLGDGSGNDGHYYDDIVFTDAFNDEESGGGANTSPYVNVPLVDQSATEGQVFAYAVGSTSFLDADAGDTLTYTATLSGGAALPSWLSFDVATQTFNGTPDSGDVGTLQVSVTATDAAGLWASDTFGLTVSASAPTNTSPYVNAVLADQVATESVAFSYAVVSGSFLDADAGDTLTYTATLSGGAALPSWLSFDAATQTFNGTPNSGDVGTLQVSVTAADAAGLWASDTFGLTVSASPLPSGLPAATLVLFDEDFANGATSTSNGFDTVAITPAGDPPGHMSASLKIVSGVWSSPGIMKEETIGSGNRILRMYVLRTAGSSGTFNVRHTTNWESITLDAASNANWRIDGLTGRSTGADLSDNDWHLLEIDLQALGVTSFKALTVLGDGSGNDGHYYDDIVFTDAFSQ